MYINIMPINFNYNLNSTWLTDDEDLFQSANILFEELIFMYDNEYFYLSKNNMLTFIDINYSYEENTYMVYYEEV